jgi:hypothetical protein
LRDYDRAARDGRQQETLQGNFRKMATAYKFEFAPRFQRSAFGWKSTIAKADVGRAVREKWLERLWDALQEDDMPYLEYLGEFWGDMCGTPEIASKWADYLSPTLTAMWDHCASSGEFGYSKGTSAC